MIRLNNKDLCENCFSEISSEPCPHCGFNKEFYRREPVTLPLGSVLNQRYMIGGVIGKGGFGITYLGFDLKLDARIAVKEYYPMGLAMRATDDTLVTVTNQEAGESFRQGAEKFYNEAKMVAKFNGNPNIVSVHDFFYENDTVYFIMGYLQGQTLKSYLKKKKITEGQAVNVMRQISNALLASHALNILHRDISPDNIMLCDDKTIRLLDFGAARQVMAEQSQSFSVILKQGYAPLEQYQKKGKQGPWTDIYALGATIYSALTGDMLNDPMSRLEDDSEYESNKYGITASLWNIIKKCTELKTTDRYQDIKDLMADLENTGIAEEPFTDLDDDIKDVLSNEPISTSTGLSGSPVPNYAPAADPNATVYLGEEAGGGEDGTVKMSLNPAATSSGGTVASQGAAPVTGMPQGVQQIVPNTPMQGPGQASRQIPNAGYQGGSSQVPPGGGAASNGSSGSGTPQGKKGMHPALIAILAILGFVFVCFVLLTIYGIYSLNKEEESEAAATEATTEAVSESEEASDEYEDTSESDDMASDAEAEVEEETGEDPGAGKPDKDGKGAPPDENGEEEEEQSSRFPIPGVYYMLGIFKNEKVYVIDESYEDWYVDLDDDGTGYIYFGEDIEGDIDHWEIEGNKLTIEAGDSTFEGVSCIIQGVMYLDFENFIMAFACDEVDRDDYKQVTVPEYDKMTS